MKRHLIYLLLLISFFGCKKLVTSDFPPNQLTPEKVYSDTTSVYAATSNLYTLLVTVDNNFVRYIDLYVGDTKATGASSALSEFANSKLTPVNTAVLAAWQNLYATIYRSNAIINAEFTTSIPLSIKNESIGEAKFIRGYSYLLLTQLWGDVPLILTTDVSKSATASRSPVGIVQDKIITDLTDASNLLSTSYRTGSKITANKYAALGYLAKAALFKGDYQTALTAATSIIDSHNYSLLSNINTISTVNNNEAILQLWNLQGFTALNAVTTSGIPSTQASPQLLNAFEANDVRKINWIGSDKVGSTSYFFPYKYKQKAAITGTNAEYSLYLRLAEIYLIRAEARANTGDLKGATTDLNTIRARAGLAALSLSTQDQVNAAILQERHVELFNEGGNRFFDLNRFGQTGNYISSIKPLWSPNGKLFPIPQSEILSDPNLTQNKGY